MHDDVVPIENWDQKSNPSPWKLNISRWLLGRLLRDDHSSSQVYWLCSLPNLKSRTQIYSMSLAYFWCRIFGKFQVFWSILVRWWIEILKSGISKILKSGISKILISGISKIWKSHQLHRSLPLSCRTQSGHTNVSGRQTKASGYYSRSWCLCAGEKGLGNSFESAKLKVVKIWRRSTMATGWSWRVRILYLYSFEANSKIFLRSEEFKVYRLSHQPEVLRSMWVYWIWISFARPLIFGSKKVSFEKIKNTKSEKCQDFFWFSKISIDFGSTWVGFWGQKLGNLKSRIQIASMQIAHS